MIVPPIELDAVQAFVLIAELRSFTRAAEALGVAQSAISLKLKRLEDQLSRRLVERTPRLVRLSPEGEAFLPAARELIAAHQRALATFRPERRRLKIGISGHVVGAELPGLLMRMGEREPELSLELFVAPSSDVMKSYNDGDLDAAIVLRHDHARHEGETLMQEQFGWFAAAGWQPREPLQIASHAGPCGLRASAKRALDEAGIAWNEVFVGSGVATVGAAVAAGLAVAALARRCAPPGTRDVEAHLGLPKLPPSDLVLHAKISDARNRATLRSFCAALRATASAS